MGKWNFSPFSGIYPFHVIALITPPPLPPSRISSHMSQPKAPNLRWSDDEIARIVAWFCERDAEGELQHLKTWNTGNKTDAAVLMLKDTGLCAKKNVIKTKTKDKMVEIIKKYKWWREKADSTGWGVIPSEHDRIADNTFGQTIADLLKSKCFWYYDLEAIMGSAPSVTPSFLAESGQQDRIDLVRVNSRAAENILTDEQYIDFLNDKDAGDISSTADIDDETPEFPASTLDWSTQRSEFTASSTAENMASSTAENTATDSALNLIRSSTPAIKRKSGKKRNSRARSVVQVDSDSDNERSSKKKKTLKLSLADAIVAVKTMDVQAKKEQYEAEQRQREQQHQAEQRQRDQQHEQTMLSLQIQLEAIKARRGGDGGDDDSDISKASLLEHSLEIHKFTF